MTSETSVYGHMAAILIHHVAQHDGLHCKPIVKIPNGNGSSYQSYHTGGLFGLFTSSTNYWVLKVPGVWPSKAVLLNHIKSCFYPSIAH